MVSSKTSIDPGKESTNNQFPGGKEDQSQGRSVSSRARDRDKLRSEMDEFMAKGGKVNEIDPHVTADPPKKPGNSYGSRPI